MPLFPDSFIRLLCLVIHSSVHLFRASEDRRDMLGKRYVFQSLDLEQETFNVNFDTGNTVLIDMMGLSVE